MKLCLKPDRYSITLYQVFKNKNGGGGDAHMIRSGFPLVREVQKIMIVIMVKVTIFRFYFFTASSFVNDFSHYSNHSVLDT